MVKTTNCSVNNRNIPTIHQMVISFHVFIKILQLPSKCGNYQCNFHEQIHLLLKNFDYIHILIMTTHSKKEILIDLFNLPPLPDKRNTLDAYMDVPHNFYVPDGKNTRLMDFVERREFERQTIDNNKGFVL